MPSDGTSTRNSVIQKVQNRNNMADMYLSRQLDEFKKYLTQKVLTIEMERLEWHIFLKDLKKCDSDDLQEFVPLLIDEFGEGEYTSRCKKLKTRFRDLFTVVELGLQEEKLSMDYLQIKEDGNTAQKVYRMLRAELRNRVKPPPIEPDVRNSSPVKAVSRNEISKSRTAGFITTMGHATPGIDQVAQANKSQAFGVNKARDTSQDQGQHLAVPRATKPFFPSIATPKPSAQEPQVRKDKHDDIEPELDLGSDSEDDDDDDDERKKGEKKKRKKDMMRNMLDKNANKMKRRRRPKKPKQPLENRIEEFFVKIDSLRIEPQTNSSTNGYLPPIAISAY